MARRQTKRIGVQKRLKWVAAAVFALWLLAGCRGPVSTPTPPTTALPPDVGRAGPRTGEEIATLDSLEKVDDHPLYTMRYYGPYDRRLANAGSTNPKWACSLFAASGDADRMLYGRNFDWEHSPALLLFTDPPDGYASVSMVNIAFLGLEGPRADTLADLPLTEREALLRAPFLPIDGLNEHGLAIGMAAVPGSEMPHDAGKATIGSLAVIREILDRARDVGEAVTILESYNIDWTGGPPIHYLIADASGRSVLVEFYEGEMVTIPNGAPFHLATNHLRAAATGDGGCRRYATLGDRLTGAEGRLTPQEAMDLLADVSQGGTQWSVVYGVSTGDVRVVMGQEYDNTHTFQLDLAGE